MNHLEKINVSGAPAAQLLRKDMRARLYQVHRLMQKYSQWCGHFDTEGSLENEHAALMRLRCNLIETWRILDSLPDEVAEIKFGGDTIHTLLGDLICNVEEMLGVLGVKCPSWDSWCKPPRVAGAGV